MGMGYFLTTSGAHIPVGSTPHLTGEEILKFRKMRSISQQALAYHLGCDVRTLREWERMGDLPIPNKNAAREITRLRSEVGGFTNDPN